MLRPYTCLTIHELHQLFRRERYRPWIRPRGARHRVQDRWRGSVDRQLAQALRATGAVRVRVLEECNANRWHVVGRGDQVVGELVVRHRSVPPLAFLHERPADPLDHSALHLSPGERGIQDLAHLLYRHEVDDTGDRKSTRLNSSHLVISYAVFCLKKKKKKIKHHQINKKYMKYH